MPREKAPREGRQDLRAHRGERGGLRQIICMRFVSIRFHLGGEIGLRASSALQFPDLIRKFAYSMRKSMKLEIRRSSSYAYRLEHPLGRSFIHMISMGRRCGNRCWNRHSNGSWRSLFVQKAILSRILACVSEVSACGRRRIERFSLAWRPVSWHRLSF
jgi:hypothetical protein